MPDEMREAMYGLLIAGDKDREMILSGEKTVSIRTGFRRYKPDTTIMLGCHWKSWAVLATVTKVRYCILKDVTPEEVRKEGFGNLNELFSDLKQYYSDINWESQVTVIEWADVQGTLVE